MSLADRMAATSVQHLDDGGLRFVRWRCRRGHYGTVDRLNVRLGMPQRCRECDAAGVVSDLRPLPDPLAGRR